MAPPILSIQRLSTCPDRPMVPKGPAPGDASVMTTPFGVRRRFHSTNKLRWPCCTVATYSPCASEPRSSSSTLPLSLNTLLTTIHEAKPLTSLTTFVVRAQSICEPSASNMFLSPILAAVTLGVNVGVSNEPIAPCALPELPDGPPLVLAAPTPILTGCAADAVGIMPLLPIRLVLCAVWFVCIRCRFAAIVWAACN